MKISPPSHSSFLFTLNYIDVQGIVMAHTLWVVSKKFPSLFLIHFVSYSYSGSFLFTIYGTQFSLVIGSLVLYLMVQGLHLPMESSWSFQVTVFIMSKSIYHFIFVLYLHPYWWVWVLQQECFKSCGYQLYLINLGFVQSWRWQCCIYSRCNGLLFSLFNSGDRPLVFLKPVFYWLEEVWLLNGKGKILINERKGMLPTLRNEKMNWKMPVKWHELL